MAGGATEAVVHSAPDGYRLFLVNPANAISASLYENLNFDFLRDIAPIANVIRTPNVLEVNPSVPVNNVSEFIAYAKAHPGKINFGSGGIGTLTHVAGELLKMMTGIDIVHVSYRGTGPAVTALLAGEVQVMFDALPSSIEHIKSGKFRALGVTSTTRSELLPDLPTVADSVPGYEASGWYGLGGPRNLPREVVDLLNKGVNSGSTDRTLKARFADLGGVMLSESCCSMFIKSEVPQSWGHQLVDWYTRFTVQVALTSCYGGRKPHSRPLRAYVPRTVSQGPRMGS